jgi:hypothetical protein
MNNRGYDNVFFIRAISILLGLAMIALFLVFADYGKILKEKQELEKKDTLTPLEVDYKLAQEVLDTIEDYYLVNKLDTKQIKVIKLSKYKIDTITIKDGREHSNH